MERCGSELRHRSEPSFIIKSGYVRFGEIPSATQVTPFPRRPPASRGQQVVDIGSDLRWIRIPFALPVAVYLPIWTRKLAIVSSTPLANCVVRSAQAAIRPEMRCPCHGASGRCGTDDLALLGKRSIKFHSDFQTNSAVPIDGDVATGSRLLRTHCVPDQPTALRHDARKLGRARLASDDSERDTIELVELDCRGRQWAPPYYIKLARAVTTRRRLPSTLIARQRGCETAKMAPPAVNGMFRRLVISGIRSSSTGIMVRGT